jgi:hypothetical protein
MKKKYSGKDGEVGFVYYWNSTNKNVGEGEQELTKLVSNKLVACELRFVRPMKSVAQANFDLDAVSKSKTMLSWSVVMESKFPMSLFSFLFVPKLGKDLQQGLDKAKINLEK